jgi:hypothetical protein
VDGEIGNELVMMGRDVEALSVAGQISKERERTRGKERSDRSMFRKRRMDGRKDGRWTDEYVSIDE